MSAQLPPPRDTAKNTTSAAPARVTVHLVRLDADLEAAGAAWLPDADRLRAGAIRCPARRAEFLAARSFLRSLLASRLGIPAGTVSIIHGLDGKPRLFGGKIEFNLSRRDRWCAVALSDDCPVGVDIEPVRPFSGMDRVVAEFFPPQARAAFSAARPEEQSTVFFRWWTLLEAAVKAAGRSLDAAVSCLDGVSHQSSEAIAGLALAVAAQCDSPITVDWHLQTDKI